MPTICKTSPLTLLSSRDDNRAVSLRPKEINCLMSNASWIYGNGRPARWVLSLATVFLCAWLSVRESRRVNNHSHLTLLAIRRQPHSLFERWSNTFGGWTPDRRASHPDAHLVQVERGVSRLQAKSFFHLTNDC